MPRFDLVTLTFYENSNLWKGKDFLYFFILKFFTQNWVSLILTSPYFDISFSYWVIKKTCWKSLFLLTWYWKIVKNEDMQFCRENLKMYRKKNKTFFILRSGDSNPRLPVIFPPMIWILMDGEGEEIKSKQASERNRTSFGECASSFRNYSISMCNCWVKDHWKPVREKIHFLFKE